MSSYLTRDIPRIGPSVWLLLSAFLLPPALVVFFGTMTSPLPHQTLWVILLGCPIPIILMSLPREYRLDDTTLHIRGWLYHLSIARENIMTVQHASAWKAFIHPRSMYCSDPSKALLVVYKTKNGRKTKSLVISPQNPAPFLSTKF